MYRNKLPTKAITRKLHGNEYLIFFPRKVDIYKSYNICNNRTLFLCKNSKPLQWSILSTRILWYRYSYISHHEIFYKVSRGKKWLLRRTICTITQHVTKVSWYLIGVQGLWATIMFMIVFPQSTSSQELVQETNI